MAANITIKAKTNDYRTSLRILVTPMSGHGHINSCHGLCEELRDRGHKVIFVVDKSFAGRLSRYGFGEVLLEAPPKSAQMGEKFFTDFIRRNADKYSRPPIEQVKEIMVEGMTMMYEQQCQLESQVEAIIAEQRPDIIIHEGYIAFPPILKANVRWVYLFSASAGGLLLDPRVPPFTSGLPLNGDRSEWRDYTKKFVEYYQPLHKIVGERLAEIGQKPLPGGCFHPMSPDLNLVMQPRELRYEELGELPPNVVTVDCFVRTVPDQKFEIPEVLRNRNGKLVLFSMGSFGCANLTLMTRLLSMLARSTHRFIVSKGPLEYELPGENMWGDKFLPQTAILPLVDLVITHGGNNTVTETFFYGKKMLVLPTFFDQFDNAQRISETGLGRRLNPFMCSEEELLGTINALVADEALTVRMAQIGERIRASKDKQEVGDLIEKICVKL